jgi:hypothetical protein
MGFWFLVVGFVNPLTLGVGLWLFDYEPCLLLWAFWLLVMGLFVLILSYEFCHMFKFLI